MEERWLSGTVGPPKQLLGLLKLVHGVLVSLGSFLPSLVFVGLFVSPLGGGTLAFGYGRPTQATAGNLEIGPRGARVPGTLPTKFRIRRPFSFSLYVEARCWLSGTVGPPKQQLGTLKLVHGVLVSQGPFLPSLVFLGLFAFSLGGGTGRTDGQTDGQHRYIMGPPSRKDGPITRVIVATHGEVS